ncbi:hypothetical protein D3C81_2005580 [compost metagenome]
MCAKQENFIVTRNDVGFFQLYPAFADGLDFPTLQHDACFVTVFYEVIVKCFSVIYYAHGDLFGVAGV